MVRRMSRSGLILDKLLLGPLMLIVSSGLAAQTAPAPQGFQNIDEGLATLQSKDDKEAFKKFIDYHVIVRPHPDPKIENFIQRAEGGDIDSFALIAFYTWSGFADFRHDVIAGKFGLMRVQSEGSAAGAYFMGRTFFIALSNRPSGPITDAEISDYIAGLRWLGLAAGMGESRAYDEAMRNIDGGRATGELRQKMMATFNGAMEDGVKERKKHPLP